MENSILHFTFLLYFYFYKIRKHVNSILLFISLNLDIKMKHELKMVFGMKSLFMEIELKMD